ncbi:MAG: HPF/RaiA family ribosome-associated protein [Oligosphaeraceae bacterium]
MLELLLTGKRLEIPEEERALAQRLADKLDADYTKLTSLRMVLDSERGRVHCEALLNGKHVRLNASSKADSLGAAISATYDKLDKQMRRYLTKVQERSIAADPELKEKIWASADLKDEDEKDAELFD